MAGKEKRDVQNAFSGAGSLRDAINVAWNSDMGSSPMYQHYTTLPKLLDKIMSRRWYLSRADSPWMNDTREMTKAFPGCEEGRRRTYIMCLSRCTSESVAMWRTYNAAEDPFAVRVSLPSRYVQGWIGKVKNAEAFTAVKTKKSNAVECLRPIEGEAVEFVEFHDVLYGALKSGKKMDKYDIRRKNVVRWNDEVYDLKNGENDESFANVEIPGREAWVKDYEWYHERESRLCIRLKRKIEEMSLFIDISDEVLQQMRFTFSPWLVDERLEESVRNVIETTLKISLDCKGRLQRLPQRYRRSALKGALNFRG